MEGKDKRSKKQHRTTCYKYGVASWADGKAKYGKDISRIAIALARVVEEQEKRISEMERERVQNNINIQDIERVIRQELRNRDEDCEELEKENKEKINELYFIIKGNPDTGIKGMAEILACLADFKPELNFLKKLKKVTLYIVIASIIAWISVMIKLFYES